MEPTKDFDFTWVLRYIWSGQKVRRSGWPEGAWCQMLDGKFAYFMSSEVYNTPDLMPIENVLATDWELVE